VNSVEEAVALVDKQAARKTNLIKIWYISLKPSDALDNYPIIEASIKKAHQYNIPVAVHAKELASAKLALRAGAKYLVHSVTDVLIDDEFIQLMKENKAVICPTLLVSKNYNKVFLDEFNYHKDDYTLSSPQTLGSLSDLNHLDMPDDIKWHRRMKYDVDKRLARADKMMNANLSKLYNAGIPIALGSDAGNIGTMHVSSYYKEIEALKNSGVSDKTILKMATINAAKAINKEHELGELAIGKSANMLLLDQNPLENIMAIKSIKKVIHKGLIYHPDSLFNVTVEDIVQQQVNGFNDQNLEEFLRPFAEDVKIYDFPDKLSIRGKDQLRSS